MVLLKAITETNEERRAPIYEAAGEPTDPRAVNPDTPLDALNLNWRERELPERMRTKHVHRLHPYLGKFIPQLVEIFLRKFFAAGQTVLDPFAGSGTTLAQANELGVNAVGYDVSAFNTLLIRAKTQRYDMERVRREVLDILGRVERSGGPRPGQPTLWEMDAEAAAAAPEGASAYLEQWFAPAALRELTLYRDLIAEYEDRDLLRVILSRAARSARLTTHFDLDFPKRPQTEPYWCYKHSRTCAPTESAIQFLRRYSLDTLDRLAEFAALRSDAGVMIRHEDARGAALPPVDGVMTSPPYVGLIDYHEQHRYAYELLGLEDRRAEEIGPAARGAGRKAQREYQDAMVAVFRNCCGAMPAGGHLIVVAGDRHGLYGEIAARCGVEPVAELRRHVNRRTGRRAGEFYESVFIWRKP